MFLRESPREFGTTLLNVDGKGKGKEKGESGNSFQNIYHVLHLLYDDTRKCDDDDDYYDNSLSPPVTS